MALNSPNPAAIVIKGLMDEANQDGKQYARQDGEWSEVAPAAGKNILINGNFTVNQYGTDLDAQYALTSADNYYVDRWVKRASSRITQMVEDVNYEPSTEYTLSCYRQDGSRVSVTANSPAGGHWDIATTHNLPLYFTDRKIQMEKGDTATEFEHEDIGTTLLKCKRYYINRLGYAGWKSLPRPIFSMISKWNQRAYGFAPFDVQMRVPPQVVLYAYDGMAKNTAWYVKGESVINNVYAGGLDVMGFDTLVCDVSPFFPNTTDTVNVYYTADAEL